MKTIIVFLFTCVIASALTPTRPQIQPFEVSADCQTATNDLQAAVNTLQQAISSGTADKQVLLNDLEIVHAATQNVLSTCSSELPPNCLSAIQAADTTLSAIIANPSTASANLKTLVSQLAAVRLSCPRPQKLINFPSLNMENPTLHNFEQGPPPQMYIHRPMTAQGMMPAVSENCQVAYNNLQSSIQVLKKDVYPTASRAVLEQDIANIQSNLSEFETSCSENLAPPCQNDLSAIEDTLQQMKLNIDNQTQLVVLSKNLLQEYQAAQSDCKLNHPAFFQGILMTPTTAALNLETMPINIHPTPMSNNFMKGYRVFIPSTASQQCQTAYSSLQQSLNNLENDVQTRQAFSKIQEDVNAVEQNIDNISQECASDVPPECLEALQNIQATLKSIQTSKDTKNIVLLIQQLQQANQTCQNSLFSSKFNSISPMISQIGEFGQPNHEQKHNSQPVNNGDSPFHHVSNNMNTEEEHSNLMASAQCNEAVAALQISVNQILNDLKSLNPQNLKPDVQNLSNSINQVLNSCQGDIPDACEADLRNVQATLKDISANYNNKVVLAQLLTTLKSQITQAQKDCPLPSIAPFTQNLRRD